MARLRLMNGPRAGETIEVGGELIIGRIDGDVVLEDAQISRRHAAVRLQGAALHIEDLGSSNGTYVDGIRISGPTPLIGGAQVRLGSLVLAVEHEPAAAPGATRLRRRPEPAGTELEQPVPAQPVERRAQPIERRRDRGGRPPVPATAPVPAGISAGVGEFRPPARRRGAGPASRSWIPVVLSFGTAVLTAIALIVYFAVR